MDKSKGFLIGGMVLLLISALPVWLSFDLYREYTRLKENDIKFQMIRQCIPETARWEDTTNLKNPEEIEKIVKKLESKSIQ